VVLECGADCNCSRSLFGGYSVITTIGAFFQDIIFSVIGYIDEGWIEFHEGIDAAKQFFDARTFEGGENLKREECFA
jgi:hypothetical protein